MWKVDAVYKAMVQCVVRESNSCPLQAEPSGAKPNGFSQKLAYLQEEVPIEDEVDEGPAGQAGDTKPLWWRNMFVRKGRLGSMQDDTKGEEGVKDEVCQLY
jgi:hypothetical protein